MLKLILNIVLVLAIGANVVTLFLPSEFTNKAHGVMAILVCGIALVVINL